MIRKSGNRFSEKIMRKRIVRSPPRRPGTQGPVRFSPAGRGFFVSLSHVERMEASTRLIRIVIARSVANEAIQSSFVALDCFAEPVIGRSEEHTSELQS